MKGRSPRPEKPRAGWGFWGAGSQRGLNVGNETFTDLDFADDVSLLASMLEIVVLALEILHEESS